MVAPYLVVDQFWLTCESGFRIQRNDVQFSAQGPVSGVLLELAAGSCEYVAYAVLLKYVAPVCERKRHGLHGLPAVLLAAVHEHAGVCPHERREKSHNGVEQVRMAWYRHKAHYSARTAVNQAGFACGKVLYINRRSCFGAGSHECLAFNLEGVCRIDGLDVKYLFLVHDLLAENGID